MLGAHVVRIAVAAVTEAETAVGTEVETGVTGIEAIVQIAEIAGAAEILATAVTVIEEIEETEGERGGVEAAPATGPVVNPKGQEVMWRHLLLNMSPLAYKETGTLSKVVHLAPLDY